MKILKSHFWYNKRQRNGIFFLVFIIVVFQALYFLVDFSSDEVINIESLELIGFQKQIDSLKKIEIEKRKPKIYPFNPNFITDFKGALLGMSLDEIDRLHQFRKQNKYVNSAKEFQRLTKIPDSLLNVIAPYFKFPDWVIQKEKRSRKKTSSEALDLSKVNYGTSLPEERIIKINVNTATFKELLKIPYIDYELCKKILEYRYEVAELQDISELKNIENFPIEKYERIVVYLKAK